MPAQHKKHLLEKKKPFSSNIKESSFFLWMIACKTHLELTGKLTWIGKMMHNAIK